jgi:hypothetical protein
VQCLDSPDAVEEFAELRTLMGGEQYFPMERRRSWTSVNDLTAATTNAPPAAGDPNGYVFDAQEQMHVVYHSADGHIDEFSWAHASTSSVARTRAVKPSRYARGAMGKAPAEA